MAAVATGKSYEGKSVITYNPPAKKEDEEEKELTYDVGLPGAPKPQSTVPETFTAPPAEPEEEPEIEWRAPEPEEKSFGMPQPEPTEWRAPEPEEKSFGMPQPTTNTEPVLPAVQEPSGAGATAGSGTPRTGTDEEPVISWDENNGWQNGSGTTEKEEPEPAPRRSTGTGESMLSSDVIRTASEMGYVYDPNSRQFRNVNPGGDGVDTISPQTLASMISSRQLALGTQVPAVGPRYGGPRVPGGFAGQPAAAQQGAAGTNRYMQNYNAALSGRRGGAPRAGNTGGLSYSGAPAAGTGSQVLPQGMRGGAPRDGYVMDREAFGNMLGQAGRSVEQYNNMIQHDILANTNRDANAMGYVYDPNDNMWHRPEDLAGGTPATAATQVDSDALYWEALAGIRDKMGADSGQALPEEMAQQLLQSPDTIQYPQPSAGTPARHSDRNGLYYNPDTGDFEEAQSVSPNRAGEGMPQSGGGTTPHSTGGSNPGAGSGNGRPGADAGFDALGKGGPSKHSGSSADGSGLIDAAGGLPGKAGGTGDGKVPSGSTYFTPSYGQDMKSGVKAPYRKGGYSADEIEAMGNAPRTDFKYSNGKLAYEGYYLAPDNQYYPVDQAKATYYRQNGYSYDGWEEGMRDYYRTFGTYYGYKPNWQQTGRNVSNYSYSPRSYSYSRSGGGRSSGYSYGSGSPANNGLYWNPNSSWSI